MALPLHVTEILQQSLSKIMIQSPISKMDTTGTDTAALYVTDCLRMISLRDNIKEGKERLQGPTLADCLERVDCSLLIN